MTARAWETIAIAFGVIALTTAIWFSGVNYGESVINARWTKERVAGEQAVAAEHERQAKQLAAYAAQVTDANKHRDDALAELDRIRDLPRPHILCHAANGSGGPVPGTTAGTGTPAAGGGQLPPQPEFDPTDALYAEADRADAIVESCRFVIGVWPRA